MQFSRITWISCTFNRVIFRHGGFNDEQNKKDKWHRYIMLKRKERVQALSLELGIPIIEAGIIFEEREKTILLGKRAKKKLNATRKIPKTRIRLISKRGTVVQGRHSCSKCKKLVHTPTKYLESSVGTVLLCAVCKPRIKQASFKTKGKFARFVSNGGGPGTGKKR